MSWNGCIIFALTHCIPVAYSSYCVITTRTTERKKKHNSYVYICSYCFRQAGDVVVPCVLSTGCLCAALSESTEEKRDSNKDKLDYKWSVKVKKGMSEALAKFSFTCFSELKSLCSDLRSLCNCLSGI